MSEAMRLIAQIKKKAPYLRIGQIVSVCAVKGGYQNGADVFYVLDETLESGAKTLLKELGADEK